MPKITMPTDWDDADGWEAYYAALYPDGPLEEHEQGGGSLSRRINEFVSTLMAKGRTSVWVAGCGIAPLGGMLAATGLQVVATDIALSAVRFQNERARRPEFVRALAENGVDTREGGSLDVRQHDFRCPFETAAFDVVINTKAFSGFKASSQRQVAGSHFAALKSGGTAYFDTRNVQGADRDRMEDALVGAGFYMPLAEIDRAYRKELSDTGIPHVFILGFPVVQTADQTLLERDTPIIRAIRDKYEDLIRGKVASEQERDLTNARHAVIIYSTG